MSLALFCGGMLLTMAAAMRWWSLMRSQPLAACTRHATFTLLVMGTGIVHLCLLPLAVHAHAGACRAARWAFRANPILASQAARSPLTPGASIAMPVERALAAYILTVALTGFIVLVATELKNTPDAGRGDDVQRRRSRSHRQLPASPRAVVCSAVFASLTVTATFILLLVSGRCADICTARPVAHRDSSPGLRCRSVSFESLQATIHKQLSGAAARAESVVASIMLHVACAAAGFVVSFGTWHVVYLVMRSAAADLQRLEEPRRDTLAPLRSPPASLLRIGEMQYRRLRAGEALVQRSFSSDKLREETTGIVAGDALLAARGSPRPAPEETEPARFISTTAGAPPSISFALPAAQTQPQARASTPPTPASSVAQRGECIVCMAAEADAVMLECGHACVCYTCAQRVLALSPRRRVCPVCRSGLTFVAKLEPLPGEVARRCRLLLQHATTRLTPRAMRWNASVSNAARSRSCVPVQRRGARATSPSGQGLVPAVTTATPRAPADSSPTTGSRAGSSTPGHYVAAVEVARVSAFTENARKDANGYDSE